MTESTFGYNASRTSPTILLPFLTFRFALPLCRWEGRHSRKQKSTTSSYLRSIDDTYLEPELPVPIVALTAVAIEHVLKFWASGAMRMPDFTIENYAHTYQIHLQALDSIRSIGAPATKTPEDTATQRNTITTGQKKFHNLMADLYNAASSMELHRVQVAEDVIAHIDFDAMRG